MKQRLLLGASILLTALLWSPVYAQTALPAGSPVTLNWSAPTQNADGTPLTDLGGYDLYCADTDAALTALPDTLHGGKPCVSTVAGVTTYIFTNLAPGTHYFAVETWACRRPCAVSVQSAHVSVTVSPPVVTPAPASAPPGAPSNVTISATVSAQTKP
jgi:hypothetical protein